MRFFVAASVLALSARAQFGPATPTAAAAGTLAPSPTQSAGCFLHNDQWECAAARTTFLPSANGHNSSLSDDEHGECIIHVGHTHGDCSAEQLACGLILLEDYSMPLHIGAIFIILITSALGVMIPLVAGWRRAGDKRAAPLDASSFGTGVGFWGNLFFLARHFGTGIILSTAFIHLLYHGFVMFNNDCVGELGFEATAPAIALASVMVTFLLDFVGSRVAHGKLTRDLPPHHPHSPSMHSPGSQSEDGHGEKDVAMPVISTEVCSHAEAVFRTEQGWQVLLLEAGIIFHSIMIGVTLGAGSGAGWTTLLIVLVFHQFFEGAALGARIALLFWISKTKTFIMGFAFMLVTPIGVAIGIGVRKSFSQNGKAALLSVGVLNSVSAGILLYTAFKLLAADFVDGPLRTARASRVIAALVAMFVGLVAMSVLGKWA